MKTTSYGISASVLIVMVSGLMLFAPHWRASAQLKSEANSESARPQFLFIQGQVKIPQRYVYTNGMTLLTAIKMAKGLTPEASLSEVRLIRGGKEPMTVNLKAIEHRKAKDIELQPGDHIFVPKK